MAVRRRASTRFSSEISRARLDRLKFHSPLLAISSSKMMTNTKPAISIAAAPSLVRSTILPITDDTGLSVGNTEEIHQ
jgi:hypothetical protein